MSETTLNSLILVQQNIIAMITKQLVATEEQLRRHKRPERVCKCQNQECNAICNIYVDEFQNCDCCRKFFCLQCRPQFTRAICGAHLFCIDCLEAEVEQFGEGVCSICLFN